jgi:hypothetical protein
MFTKRILLVILLANAVVYFGNEYPIATTDGKDDIMLINAAYRMTLGQTPNEDFRVAYGPLTTWVHAMAMLVTGVNTDSFVLMHVFLFSLFAIWAYYLADKERLPIRIMFTLFVGWQASGFYPIGNNPEYSSQLMLYNRIGWALVSLIVYETFCRRSNKAGGYSTGAALVLIALTKVSYLAVVPVIFMNWPKARPERYKAIGYACVIGVVALLVAQMAGISSFAGYFNDTIGAYNMKKMEYSMSPHFFVAKNNQHLTYLWLPFAITVFYMIAAKAPLTKYLALPCLLSISFGNSDLGFCPPLALMFLGGRMPNPRIARFLTFAMMSIIPFNHFDNIIYERARAKHYVTAPEIEELKWKFVSLRTQVDGHQFKQMTDEGVALVKKHTPPNVHVFAFCDAVTPAAGIEPSKGTAFWNGVNPLYHEGKKPSPEEYFAHTDAVLFPRKPLRAKDLRFMAKEYGPYLEKNFVGVDNGTYWVYLKRKGVE